jgi:cobalt/nickel transport system permease protein
MLLIAVPLRLILARMAAPMGMALVVAVLSPFIRGSTPLFGLTVFGRELTATSEGLSAGLLLGARVLAAVSVILLLSLTTPAHKIFAVFRWAKAPALLVEIAMLTYRYTFTLIEDTADILAAQRVRLGYVGFRRSLASMGVLAGSVVEQSLEQAARTHEAMRARCYTGTLVLGRLGSLKRRDVLELAFLLLGLCSAFLFLEGWLP